jgi:hypothetical protein
VIVMRPFLRQPFREQFVCVHKYPTCASIASPDVVYES